MLRLAEHSPSHSTRSVVQSDCGKALVVCPGRELIILTADSDLPDHRTRRGECSGADINGQASDEMVAGLALPAKVVMAGNVAVTLETVV